jgi:hypothetical protein
MIDLFDDEDCPNFIDFVDKDGNLIHSMKRVAYIPKKEDLIRIIHKENITTKMWYDLAPGYDESQEERDSEIKKGENHEWRVKEITPTFFGDFISFKIEIGHEKKIQDSPY